MELSVVACSLACVTLCHTAAEPPLTHSTPPPPQAVLDKADVVLAMDDEMQAQQAQQAAQQASAAAEPSEGGTSDAAPTDAAAAGAAAAGPRMLARSDTGTSEPGSGGSLPPGIDSSGRMASNASQEAESPLAGATSGVPAPSLYVSAAPSVQLEAGESGGGEADVAATVLLETLPDGTVQLSILLPAAAEQEGTAEGEEEVEEESEGELPPELAGAAARGRGVGCRLLLAAISERPLGLSAASLQPELRVTMLVHRIACRRRGGGGAAHGAPGPSPAGSRGGGAGESQIEAPTAAAWAVLPEPACLLSAQCADG